MENTMENQDTDTMTAEQYRKTHRIGESYEYEEDDAFENWD